jgi:hypothetical protein
MRNHRWLLIVAVVGALMMGAAASASAVAVAPRDAHPYGKTYSQWAGRWLRWAMEMPADASPFTGTAGCGQDQHGRVFFLPIQFGPGASFVCRVQVGHSLLLSPMGGVCSPADGDGTTVAEVRACATSIFPIVSSVHVRIDGRRVRHARRWRFVSPTTDVNFPANNVLGATPGPSWAIGAGWFYLIRPLPPGRHTIASTATLQQPFGSIAVTFNYRIEVTHGGIRR